MDEDRPAAIERLCRCYVSAMEKGDLDALLALFAPDATATSPISGKQPAADFYANVMRITGGRLMEVRTVFTSATGPSRAALHMRYTRTVGDRPPATIEAVDVFDLTDDLQQIAAVTIIYDTAPVRSDFESG